MMFCLYANPYRLHLGICRATQLCDDADSELLAQRDPEIPLEFKSGGGYLYLNPCLRKAAEAKEPFFLLDNCLTGFFSGKPISRTTKAEAAALARTWFELVPQTLKLVDLSSDLRALLKSSPKLIGVIAQRLRATLGLRVPAELAFNTTSEWEAWLTTQQVPLPLRPGLKNLFKSVGAIAWSRENREFMINGVEPEPLYLLRARWVQIRQVTTVTRRLYESGTQEVTFPQSVIAGGAQAVISYLDTNYPDWRNVAEYYTGSDEAEVTSEQTVSGPLLTYRPLDGKAEFAFLDIPPDWANAPVSVHDIIAKELYGS